MPPSATWLPAPTCEARPPCELYWKVMPPKKGHVMFVSNLCNPQLDPENIFSPHYNREVESYFVMLFFRDHLTSLMSVLPMAFLLALSTLTGSSRFANGGAVCNEMYVRPELIDLVASLKLDL